MLQVLCKASKQNMIINKLASKYYIIENVNKIRFWLILYDLFRLNNIYLLV